MKYEVHAELHPYRKSVSLYVIAPGGMWGPEQCAAPLTMVPVPDGETAEPTFTIKTDEAQFLMDELWKCGLRPTEGTGSAGSLSATERHLKDMQTIALGLLRKDGMA